MKKLGLTLLALGCIVLTGAGTAHALTTTDFDLVARNLNCLPNAAGHVTVFHKEDALGVDTLRLTASGLPANTEFTVFLTERDAFATPAFGATQYVGDFTTNAAGVGSLQVDAIVADAFTTAVGGAPPARVRTDLDHLVIWWRRISPEVSAENGDGIT